MFSVGLNLAWLEILRGKLEAIAFTSTNIQAATGTTILGVHGIGSRPSTVGLQCKKGIV